MKHQKLSLPNHWKITYNEFFVVDPVLDNEDDASWCNFKEDMLQIENETMGLIIDLGWCPEFNITGEFKLMLLEQSNRNNEKIKWGDPLKEYCSKNRLEIVRTIEKWVSDNEKS